MTVFELSRIDPADNLAIDEAIQLVCEEGRATGCLRFWESPVIAVILGASSRIDADVYREAVQADHIRLLRRCSGGGTVLIGPGALNFTVVLPIEYDSRLRTVEGAQSFVMGRISLSLGRFGPVELLGSGDLTIRGRKFAGSAQRRLRRTVLIHATVLYDFPLESISRYLKEPKRRPQYRGTRSHSDFIANTNMSRFNIISCVNDALLIDNAINQKLSDIYGISARLVVEKYGDREWTERF